MSGAVHVEGGSSLAPYAGKAITLDGSVSRAPWQHTISPPVSHGIATYFDHGNLQTIAYSKKPLPQDTLLRLHGTVLAVAGRAKRPGEDDQYTEYHVVVDSWEDRGPLERAERPDATSQPPFHIPLTPRNSGRP